VPCCWYGNWIVSSTFVVFISRYYSAVC
jgi:hypothetical protein